MFKIILIKPGMVIEMPKDKHLSFLDACYRADIYHRNNRSAAFTVINEDNGDVEYQTII